MHFELMIGPELLDQITRHGIRVNAVAIDALWTAVTAAEAAQELGEGIEPDADEEAAQAAADEPYATVKDWYTGSSYYELMNEIRRRNRKAFGRRAKLTIYSDGNLLTKVDGTIAGAFIVEVRRSKRES